MEGPISREIAGRLASTAAGIDGVQSVTVCSAEGQVLGSAGMDDPAREAALASFVALRAEALPVDGDLRGMGRQLAGSSFSHLAIVGDRSETLLFSLNRGAYLSVQVAPGRSSASAVPLGTLVRRVLAMSDSSMRSSQP
ncbi:MAG: hypothetical protein ABI577_12255 [bacterium]